MVRTKTSVPVMKRAWFVKGGQLGTGNESPTSRLSRVEDECRKRKLKYVQSFNSWHADEGAVALALDKDNNPVILGSEPFAQRVTLPEALHFMADMCDADGGCDGGGKADFFELLAVRLEGGVK